MVDNAKLARLQQSVRIVTSNSGKGTPRRKVKKVHKEAGVDDKKLQGALKKLNVQPIPQIEEVNFFRDDGKITHFSHPTVHAAVPSNTYAIYGHGQEKELAELVPGILTQLGPESLNSLRQLAEQYQALQSQAQGNAAASGSGEQEGEKQQGDDEIPDLVESFENKVE